MPDSVSVVHGAHHWLLTMVTNLTRIVVSLVLESHWPKINREVSQLYQI